MAMICVRGGHECNGCMACQDRETCDSFWMCEHCLEPIPVRDDHYALDDGVRLHEDCMPDYMREHYLVLGRC